MKDSRCKCSYDSFNPACPLHGEYWVDGVRVIQQHHLPGGGVVIPKDHPAYAHYFPQKSRATTTKPDPGSTKFRGSPSGDG